MGKCILAGHPPLGGAFCCGAGIFTSPNEEKTINVELGFRPLLLLCSRKEIRIGEYNSRMFSFIQQSTDGGMLGTGSDYGYYYFTATETGFTVKNPYAYGCGDGIYYYAWGAS